MKRSAHSPPHQTAGTSHSSHSSAKIPKYSIKSESPADGINTQDVNSPAGPKTAEWFEKMPTSGAEFSNCVHFISGSRDRNELLQFANILMAYLRALSQSSADDDIDDDDNMKGVSAPPSSPEHVNEVIRLLQQLIMHLDPLLEPKQKPLAHQLLIGLMEMYLLGTLDFSSSRIPEILVRLYPAGAVQLVNFVRNTGDISLLLPVCSASAKNFITITKFLAQSPSSSRLVAELITRLLSDLDRKFILPDWIRDVAIFEEQFPFTEKFAPSARQFHKALNKSVYRCIQSIEEEDGDEAYMEFMLSTQPQTRRLLNDQNWEEKVQRWEFPELWQFLKRRSAMQTGLKQPSSPIIIDLDLEPKLSGEHAEEAEDKEDEPMEQGTVGQHLPIQTGISQLASQVFIDQEAEVSREHDDDDDDEAMEQDEIPDEQDILFIDDSSGNSQLSLSQKAEYSKSLVSASPQARPQLIYNKTDPNDSYNKEDDEIEYDEVGVYTQKLNEAMLKLEAGEESWGVMTRKQRQKMNSSSKATGSKPASRSRYRRIITPSPDSDD